MSDNPVHFVSERQGLDSFVDEADRPVSLLSLRLSDDVVERLDQGRDEDSVGGARFDEQLDAVAGDAGNRP